MRKPLAHSEHMNTNTFANYREIISRFASVGKCGHAINKGDTIGWHRVHGAQCAKCWQQWKADNAAADFDERQINGQ